MRLKRFSFAILSEPKVRGIPARKTDSELTVFSFTRDSVVLIAAKDGEATPMYKYDYRAIGFGESASEGVQVRFMGQNADLSQPAK